MAISPGLVRSLKDKLAMTEKDHKLSPSDISGHLPLADHGLVDTGTKESHFVLTQSFVTCHPQPNPRQNHSPLFADDKSPPCREPLVVAPKPSPHPQSSPTPPPLPKRPSSHSSTASSGGSLSTAKRYRPPPPIPDKDDNDDDFGVCQHKNSLSPHSVSAFARSGCPTVRRSAPIVGYLVVVVIFRCHMLIAAT